MSCISEVLSKSHILSVLLTLSFLSCTQAARADAFDNFFIFVDSVPEVSKKHCPYRLVPWSSADKQSARQSINQLIETAPGLAQLTATPNKFPLGRAVKVPAKGGTTGQFDAAAATHFNLMVFADSFFDMTEAQQLDAMAHELTHSADIGQSLAFSRTWASFAMPRIRKARCLTGLYKKDIAANQIRSAKIFPDSYAGENLIESLAVCFSAYQTGNKTVEFDQEIRRKMFDQLQHPDARMLEFATAYRTGAQLVDEEKYEEAIKQFRRCELLFPENPAPTAFVARCYSELHDEIATLRECDHTLQKLDAAGIDHTDSFRLAILRAKERVFYNREDFAAAAACCSESLLSELPGSFRNWQLRMRSRHYQDSQQWFNAASDLMALNDKQKLWHNGHDELTVEMDLDFMTAQLDLAIANNPNFARPLLSRAAFREALADRAQNQEEKIKLYDSALADLRQAITKGSSAEALLCAAQVNIKLGRYDDASKSIHSLAQQGFEEYTNPLEIAILEKTNKPEQAKELYINFQRRMLKRDGLLIPVFPDREPKQTDDPLKDVG